MHAALRSMRRNACSRNATTSLHGQKVMFEAEETAWRPDNCHDRRLVVAVAYRLQIVCVKFIGTHHQHDAIDTHTIEPS